MIDGKRVLMIIPAYNESANIKNVVENLRAIEPDVDYVVINDCSKDNTEEILRENGFNYISLPVNLGIGSGVQTGYRYAVQHDYDIAIQHDGDGQHDPKYIRDVIAPIIAGKADMVIGSRFIEKVGFQSSGMRRFAIRLLKILIKLCCGCTVLDNTSGYRATSKDLTAYFAEQYAQDYPEPEAIIAANLAGFRVTEVPVQMHERQGGKSSIGGFGSVYYMIKVSLAIIIDRMGAKRRRKKQ